LVSHTIPNSLARGTRERQQGFSMPSSGHIGTTLPHNPGQSLLSDRVRGVLSRVRIVGQLQGARWTARARNEKCLLNYTTFVVRTTSARPPRPHGTRRRGARHRDIESINQSIMRDFPFPTHGRDAGLARSCHCVCESRRLNRFRSAL